ncbi:MAG: ABC transporter ATP-binding protein [Stomatobaculum sp.]
MKKLCERLFAMTEKGAQDLVKASFASFAVYAVNMLPAVLLMLLFDDLVLGHSRSRGFYIVLSALILFLMYLLLRIEYNAFYNATYAESAHLRINIADTLAKLPLSYFSKHDLSDISQTVMSDVAAIEHAMSHAMGKALGFCMFFPLCALLLLSGSIPLGLSVILPILLGFALIFLSKKIQLRENARYYWRLRENSERFQETIELQQEIRSFGLAEKLRRTLDQKMDESERIHLKTEIIAALPLLLSTLVVQSSFAIVALTGVSLWLSGKISVLYLIGYVLVSIRLKDAVDSVSQTIAELYYIDSPIRRIREMRAEPTQQGEDLRFPSYDIQLENVRFSYSPDTPVLKGVSFEAKAGEVTALVGMSGCGKTSILRLISRLYDYTDGVIKIGGLDIRTVSTRALFDKVSIVFQDVSLFNASVLENIRLGRMSATDEEVKGAAEMAGCAEFIAALPEGFDTVIGENGAALSGGERQRLSIARAFLKDAPIVILDEIAASLDVENEKKLQDSLNLLLRGKTVVIISHRLKSIENADKIVVISEGSVEAAGRHTELLHSSPTYARLVENARLAEEFTY